jgi:GNAT superfamily N-acetyltransferase
MASAMAHSSSEIGRLAADELPEAQALVAEAGWNQVAADWRIFLECGTVYAIRAEGRVIATAATLPYGHYAWISMVLVAGQHRRRGLATRLLNHCIAEVTGSGRVPVLDATPAGRTVYAPLGFREACGFTRLIAQPATSPDAGAIEVQSITDAVWPALCAADAAAFGADRSGVLARLRGRLPAANLFAQRAGGITGMLLGRDGRTAAQLGPLTAEDDLTAQALLAHGLRRIDGPVYIDLADAKPEVRRFLETSGFSPQRPFTRMLLGRDGSFANVARTFAVIGPEFG